MRDRMVQAAVVNVIEPIFERDFAEHSYGFRPGRGCKDALRRVDHLIKSGYYYIVDAGLKGYFDSIPHDRLMVRLEEKIADGPVLSLIERFLTANILDGLEEWTPITGAPQGAVLTPPTMLQTILLGATLKRGGTDPIHNADLPLINLDLLDQGADDLPLGLPVRLAKSFGNLPREFLQLADHQPQLRLPALLLHLPYLARPPGVKAVPAPRRSSARIRIFSRSPPHRHRSVEKCSFLLA